LGGSFGCRPFFELTQVWTFLIGESSLVCG
jgi:hypothetical protein